VPAREVEVCPVCGGVGFFRVEVPLGDPRFGKALPCPRCKLPEIQRQRVERLRQLAGVPEDLSAYTFETFDPERTRCTPSGKRAMALIKAQMEEYAERPQGWLVLQGVPGSGKTHLAYAVVERCLARGHGVYYSSVPEMLDALREGYHDGAEMNYDQRMRTMCEAALLVLDDLGTEQPTPWVGEKVFQMINYRYTRRLPLVVTTNLNVRERDCGLEPRVLSRLNDVRLGRVLSIPAGDFRRYA
jgi:DNA replication protein DnaC